MADHGPTAPRIVPIVRHDGKVVLNIFQTLAHNPKLRSNFLALGSTLLTEGLLTPRDREIVILRVGWLSGAEYEFGQHTTIGRLAGLTDVEIQRLADCGTGAWSSEDAALVAAADELCSNNVISNTTWERLADRFDEPTLIEILLLVGFYRMVSGMLNSAGVALEPGTEGWPTSSQPVRRSPRQVPT